MNGGPITVFLIITIFGLVLAAFRGVQRKSQGSVTFEELLVSSIPYCLYLRSFADDGTGTMMPHNASWIDIKLDTFENKLARHLYGKTLVAVGRPGEDLATLGAKKLYLKDSEWKEKVGQLILKASMIVIKPSETSGLEWELEQIIRTKNLWKMVLFHTFNDFGDRKLKEYYYSEFVKKMNVEYGFEMISFNPVDRYSYFDEETVHQKINWYNLNKHYEELIASSSSDNNSDKVSQSEMYEESVDEINGAKEEVDMYSNDDHTEYEIFTYLKSILSVFFVFMIIYVTAMLIMNLFFF